MRPLLWLVGAQSVGILLADAGWLRPDGAFVLAAAALGIGLPWRRARLPCAALAFLAAGALALGSRLEGAARSRPEAARELVVEGVVGEVARGPGWLRLDLHAAVAVDPAAASVPGRVRLLARGDRGAEEPLESLGPGVRMRARLELRAPRDRRNPGAPQRARAAARQGIGAEGRLVHPALVVRRGSAAGAPPRAWLEPLRQRLAARLTAAGPGGGLLAALAVGDRRGLSAELREPFARLGIAHLLAVSGLHLGLVAALAFGGLWAAARRSATLAARWDTRRVALAGALATALGYALLAGWGVPVRRALILLGAAALAVARGRPTRRAEPLAAAALLILAREPQALFEPGAQLSFAATAALLGAAPAPVPPGTGRLARGLRGALRASASAVAVTAPIAAAQLGRVAPFALAVNVVAIPCTAVALLPVAAAAALAAALPGAPGAQAVLTAAERVACAALAGVAWLAAHLPPLGAGVAPAPAWWLAAWIPAALALRARRTRFRVGWAAAVGCLLAAAPAPALDPPPPRAVALDVGQGDAALLQGRRGAVLVDAGTALPGGPDLGRSAVLPALRALGVRRLDRVVASHADLDHRGGLPAVLGGIRVDGLWLPRGALTDPGFAPLLKTARARGVPVEERGSGDPPLRLGDLVLESLWPPSDAPASRNDRSLVVRATLAGRRLLLPGDLEAAGEAALLASGADLRADVLWLPHHGSRSSSTRAFLEAVSPALAIASAPEHSRFGMPAPVVRRRAEALGAALWWTGRDGAVLVGLAPTLRARGFAD